MTSFETVGQTNINIYRVSELKNWNINVVSKFVEKMLKYRIVFKDILTFLGLDNRDASHFTLHIVVIRISIPKIRSIG